MSRDAAPARHRRSLTLKRRARAMLSILVGLALGFAFLPAPSATAAGPAVVSVVVTITDTNGTPLTTVNAATIPNGRYVVNVAYSCLVANCNNTQVVIPGPATDSFYGAYRRELNSYIFNPPFTPAPPISGTAWTGLTVNLGTVNAGTSGAFSVAYTVSAQPLGVVAGGSFFLNGSTISRQATISAANSNSPATATSNTPTWVSTVPSPGAGLSAKTVTATDADVTVSWSGSTSGCLTFNGSFLDFQGAPWLTCAKAYTATVQLPAKAVYVPGSGGIYDPVTHSVTFAETGRDAAAGIYGRPRTFRVRFPSTDYPTTSPGCVVTERFIGSHTVTYLEDTVKTANTTRDIQIGNCAPFGKANMGKSVWNSTTNSAAASWPIPTSPGGTLGGLQWRVTVNNQGNVPGVATITDTTLDLPDLPVTSVGAATGTPATINYTLDNGTTGTATNSFTAPAGRRIVAVTATSASLAGPNVEPSGTLGTPFSLIFNTSLSYGATPGQRCNTASGSVSYPDYPQLSTINTGPVTYCVTLTSAVGQTRVTAGAPAATVTGGGTPLVGSEVIWRASGTLSNLTTSSTFTPQYVFIAPPGWTIAANGASFTSSAPAGATFDYRTVTYNGTQRQAVVVNWPGPLGQTGTVSLPQLAVKTSPTVAAPAGTNNQVATFLVGDVTNSIAAGGYSPVRYNDTTDIDGDGASADAFALANGTTSLAPSLALGVVKEICKPNPAAADGCDWIADSSIKVGVPPSATSIKYRVTIQNKGNTALNNVVAYDVLPYLGDTGTSTATATTPRGSTVKEVLAGVSNVSAGVTLAYSTSTNPPRPEVYVGATTGDWTAPTAGASSIRATIATLPFGESRSFMYDASLVGGFADQVACNSVAANATLLSAIEPPAVCASTEEADLRVEATTRLPLQTARPGVVPFVVTNGGGSQEAPAELAIQVPAEVTITDLTQPGWDCTAPSNDGPTTITCLPVEPDGTSRMLVKDTSETVEIGLRPSSAAPSTLCFDASVSGLMTDPNLGNNEVQTCSSVIPAPPEITVTKDDGTDNVDVGEETTYTITATNRLVGESLSNVTLTDTLPAGVELVSSTPPATVNGSTLTWDLSPLAQAGTAGDGTNGTGGPGSSKTVSVTVRVLPGTMDTISNVVDLTAPDPADTAQTLAAQATDVDTVINVFTDLAPAETTPHNTPVTTPLDEIVSATGAPLDPTSVSQQTAPTHGTLAIDPGTGAVTYLPAPGYSGPDSYQIAVCDTSTPAQCTVGTVTVTVGVNIVTAEDDTASTSAPASVTTDVRANDTSESGEPFALPTVPGPPANGTAAVNGDGTITYTPGNQFSGTDTYTYEVCDTSNPTPVCDTATVTVQVANVFVNPRGGATVETPHNTPVTTPLDDIVTTTGAPMDPTSVTQATAPQHGSIAIDPATGAVTYTPEPGYAGPDEYQVNACDTSTPTPQCGTFTVPVTVLENSVAAPDLAISTRTNEAAAPIDVLAVTTSASGQPLDPPTITVDPQHGTVVVNPDGTITYTPADGYDGEDSFVYQVCDTSHPTPVCDTGTVTVTVTKVADLSITKTLQTEKVVAGLPITYEAITSNAGPSTALDVHTVDPVPQEILDPIGTPDPDVPGGSCETRPTLAADLDLLNPDFGPYSLTSHPLVVECTYPELPAGITIVDVITGTVDPAVTHAIVNQVASFAATYDPVLSNNLGRVSTEVAAEADVVLTKTAEVNRVDYGDEVTFLVRLENRGPSDATGLVISDTPTDLKHLSAEATLGDFDADAGTWTIRRLRVGEEATLTTVHLVRGPDAGNVARVAASDVVDPRADNNGGDGCPQGSEGCGFVVLRVAAQPPVDEPSDEPAELPNTGNPVSSWPLRSGLLLVLAGVGALWLSRRRAGEQAQ